jgi:integrase
MKGVFMRKRFQKGSLRKVGNSWVAQWREGNHRRSKTLGDASVIGKSEAQRLLAELVAPVNAAKKSRFRPQGFTDFVSAVFLPWANRKWKESTATTTTDRIQRHLCRELENQLLKRFTREQLQGLLDRKVASGLGSSTVSHLRWDLRQIFALAVADGYVERNPAEMLFTPRNAPRARKRTMTWKEVKLVISVLESRERLVVSLAIIAGMRPGEILGLQWKHISEDRISVCQRIYRGKIDTPKNRHSVREVALSDGLQHQIEAWKAKALDHSPDDWVFPSERNTPLSRDNILRRWITPRLKTVGLEWVNFQVMRRTHSSLMQGLDVNPKIVADQLGHTLDVNLNVYTRSDVASRQAALNLFEDALLGLMEQTH